MLRAALLCLTILVASFSSAQQIKSTSLSTGILDSGAGILTNKEIQKELGLSPAVSKKIDDKFANEIPKIKISKDGTPQLPPNFKPREMIAKTKKVQRECLAMLTPPQKARLQEIAIQQMGANAMLTPELKKNLGLTAEQSERISAIVSQGKEKFFAGVAGLKPSSDPAEMNRRREEYIRRQRDSNARQLQESLKVLKPGQIAKWKAMLGRPFKL